MHGVLEELCGLTLGWSGLEEVPGHSQPSVVPGPGCSLPPPAPPTHTVTGPLLPRGPEVQVPLGGAAAVGGPAA